MLEFVSNFIQHNPFVAGGLGVAAAGWFAAHASSLPARVWGWAKDMFSVTLTVWSEDHIYNSISQWLSQHPSTTKMRRLAITRFWYDQHPSENNDFDLVPGPGLHMMWYGRRPFFLHRHVASEDKSDGGLGGSQRRQTITITIFGRSQKPIRAFLDEIRRVEQNRGKVGVYLWDMMGFVLIERRAKRSLETIYCASGLKEDLHADLKKFYGERANYQSRGIPYRRGYLLEGPPGTGKTSLIYAMASELEKPIYLLNPATLDNDNQLHHAVNFARDGFLVIEDIDSLRASESRITAKQADTVGEASKSGVTLAGLLNALDGIGTREGNVLFLTSNTPEALEPALLRPGRIDRRFRLDPAGENEAKAMFKRLKPTGNVDKFMREMATKLPCAQAEIQNIILIEDAA